MKGLEFKVPPEFKIRGSAETRNGLALAKNLMMEHCSAENSGMQDFSEKAKPVYSFQHCHVT